MIKLDKKNKDLIASLLNNCRNSNAKIGKEIGLSREVVAYRISSLEKEGVIAGYTADINFNRLGFSAYCFSIKFQNISKSKEDVIISLLKDNKKIVFLQKTISRYDLTATIIVKSLEELNIELNNLRYTIGDNLKYMEVEAFLGDYDFTPSFFKKGSQKTKEINFLASQSQDLDEVDKKILHKLVKNSRESAVDISKEIKISVFAIANRIKNLVKKGIILAFKPIINMDLLGYHRYTILLNMFDVKKENELINFCRNHNLIWDMGKFISNYNYAIEIFAENNDRFKGVVEEIINLFGKSIIDYETLIVLKELKHEYFFV